VIKRAIRTTPTMTTTQPRDMTAHTAIFFDRFIFRPQTMAAGMIMIRMSVRTDSPAVMRKKLITLIQVPVWTSTLPESSYVSVLYLFQWYETGVHWHRSATKVEMAKARLRTKNETSDHRMTLRRSSRRQR
jgi:hypothetical protein